MLLVHRNMEVGVENNIIYSYNREKQRTWKMRRKENTREGVLLTGAGKDRRLSGEIDARGNAGFILPGLSALGR